MRAFLEHDHNQCCEAAIEAAEAKCEATGLRLTDIRRRVLEILLENHRAIGAYEILARLQEEGYGSHPPVAYRALDFLVANGFAHKLEKANAFIACSAPEQGHNPVFFICRSCGSVAEAHSKLITNALAKTVEEAKFRVEKAAVELEGLCSACEMDA
ncbi:MAG: Fur family transcriptional regulator [Alphaproteobacteria bacterium]|jgi:Fur family zinc uptake transcriptional regulator